MIESIELKYLLIPFVSAFIGWLTNWIAIKMLFHPKKPIKIGFIVLHGIFHRRQKDIAHKLGETIEKKLFSHNDVHDILVSDEFIEGLLPTVDAYIDDFIKNRLLSIHPMLAMIPEAMLELIREKLLAEFKLMIPKLMENAEETLEENLKIKDVIKAKIEGFDVSELEDILFSILKSEFKMIEYIGGILGFIIGLTQIAIIKLF